MTRILPLLLFGAASAGCATLSVWQIQRRDWKVDLLRRRELGLNSKAVSVNQLVREGADAETFEQLYDSCQRVSISGQLVHESTMKVGPRGKPGFTTPGWMLVTPLLLSDVGEDPFYMMVYRGWVPSDWKSSESTDADVACGEHVSMEGILRATDKSIPFMGDTGKSSEDDTWRWTDLSHMHQDVKHSLPDNVQTIPLLFQTIAVEGESESNAFRYPLRVSSTTLMTPHTTPWVHTVYAATWGSISMIIAGMTLSWLRGPGKRL